MKEGKIRAAEERDVFIEKEGKTGTENLGGRGKVVNEGFLKRGGAKTQRESSAYLMEKNSMVERKKGAHIRRKRGSVIRSPAFADERVRGKLLQKIEVSSNSEKKKASSAGCWILEKTGEGRKGKRLSLLGGGRCKTRQSGKKGKKKKCGVFRTPIHSLGERMGRGERTSYASVKKRAEWTRKGVVTPL